MRIVLELLFRKDLTDHLAKKKKSVVDIIPVKALSFYFLSVSHWFKNLSISEKVIVNGCVLQLKQQKSLFTKSTSRILIK